VSHPRSYASFLRESEALSRHEVGGFAPESCLPILAKFLLYLNIATCPAQLAVCVEDGSVTSESISTFVTLWKFARSASMSVYQHI
jgi:hypothetical protein